MFEQFLMAWTLATGVQADLHLDTPTQLHRQDVAMDATSGLEASIGQLRAGGTNLAVEVLWPPRGADHLAHTKHLMDLVERDVAAFDELVLVRSPAEAREAADAGRIGVAVSLEGGHGLGTGDWRAEVEALHGRGLGLIGLTWSFSNRFAGSSGDGGAGLTDEGRELVAWARAAGVVLDVSHASRATTMEVCRTSRVPVIASHSDAHALNGVARNLTDDEIRCIAKSGGVIGLNFHAPFVGGTRDVSRVADHAEHLAAVGGKGVVALGSDYDGMITSTTGLEDASKLPALWEELARRGWTADELAGVRGENFLRAWQAVLDGAG